MSYADEFTMYFAYGSNGVTTFERHAKEQSIAFLVAVPFLKEFQKHRHKFNVRRVLLDSGAFTAWNTGKPMEYARWKDAALSANADEIAALDAIGNPELSYENWQRALSEGIECWPTYHMGEPIEWLKRYAREADKIGLGGAARRHHSIRLRWFNQCVSRIWPKRTHGFAGASTEAITSTPFHSVDASSWCLAPSAMGAWCGFTSKQITLSSRGIKDFWGEVLEHLRRERLARSRFGKQIKQLT